MDIVRQIIDETKNVIRDILSDFRQLDYEYEIEANNDRGLAKSFGFIPQSADFADRGSIGFTTVDHGFQLILTDVFLNKDDDRPQGDKLSDLYAKAHELLQELQKRPLALPTAGYRVLLISGISFDAPEFYNENGAVALRLNFNYQYRFKINC